MDTTTTTTSSSSAIDVLDQLAEVLEEERAAIRALDGDRVADLADEKAELLRELWTCDVTTCRRDEVAPRLRALAAELKRNGVLLAHARDCLRDVLAAATHGAAPAALLGAAGAQPGRGMHPSVAQPALLSRRG